MADPLYRQIADDLRARIEDGRFDQGSQLPTEIELREQYDASRNTVRDAIKWLITRGLVETRPGQGTFVVERIQPFITTLSEDPESGFGGDEHVADEAGRPLGRPQARPPRVEIQLAPDNIAIALRLASNDAVISRYQQRYIHGRPWSTQVSFYPMRLVEQGATALIQAMDISEGVHEYLLKVLNLRQAGYRDLIAVRAPNETETAFFNLPEDGRVAVVEVSRTAFDQAGDPFRLTVSVYPADRNQFAVNIGDVPSSKGNVPSSKKASGGGGRQDAQDHARQ
jgi:GntR family transcriptional regulator